MSKQPKFVLTVTIDKDLEDKIVTLRAAGTNISGLVRSLLINHCVNHPIFESIPKQTEDNLESEGK